MMSRPCHWEAPISTTTRFRKDNALAIRYVMAAAALSLLLAQTFTSADTTIPDLPTVTRKLSLQDARALAGANNINLKQAHADVSGAIAAAKSATAQTRPSVAATTYGLVGDSNNIVASSPGVMPPNYFGTPTRGVLDQNVIAMAPLFTRGKLTGQANAAAAQSAAAAQTERQTALTVDEGVTDAYVKALLQAELVDVAQARLTAEDEQVRITGERVKTGRSAPVDLLREQAEQANAQQGVLAAKNDAAIALVDLKTTLGVSQMSDITLTDTLDTVTVGSSLPASLPDSIRTAETDRPDYAAARSQVKAAQESIKSAQGAYSPQVYALGMADATGTSGDGSRVGYTVGLTASIPLYDSGQRRADVDAAKARLDRAIADAQGVRLSIDQEVATAWLNVQTAARQVQAAQVGVTAAQQGYDLANMRYNAGKSVVAERLDALSALTRAEGDWETAKAALIIARARLLAADGSANRPPK
jgi:outer membrane protein TolC